MSLSRLVRELITTHPELSNSEIARRVGVTQSLVSRIRNPKAREPLPEVYISPMDFEPILKARINQLGCSITSLGHCSGVHPENIRRYLSGKQHSITHYSLCLMAEALGLRFHVEYLNADTLPENHPALRLTRAGWGGRNPRNVWTGKPQRAVGPWSTLRPDRRRRKPVQPTERPTDPATDYTALEPRPDKPAFKPGPFTAAFTAEPVER